jgi:hypothetical protein
MTYLVHIIAGTLGLLTGYVALYAAKGGTLHRKSGMLFVYTTIVLPVLAVLAAMFSTGSGASASDGPFGDWSSSGRPKPF